MSSTVVPTEPPFSQQHESAQRLLHPFRLPLFGDSSRFVVVALSMLCLTAVSANSLLLNFTVICNQDSANFSSEQQGLLLAGTAIGGIVAIGPVPQLIHIFGLRLVFSLFGLLSGLVTLLHPLLFSLGGLYAILGVRIVQGLCLMPAMPAMSQITHHWANTARRENALFLTMLSLYMQFGIILTMPATGALCASPWGWRSAYYLFGALCLLLFLAFLLLYRNSPAQSPFVSVRELSALNAANSGRQGARSERVPYAKMLTDPTVWSLIASGIAYGLAYWLFAQYGPTYMNKVLGYQVNRTGVWVAVPYCFAIFSKLTIPLCDRFPRIPLRVRIVWIPFSCQIVNIVCSVLLAIWPASSHLLAQTAIIVVLCFNGAGFVAVANNCQVVAQRHAHFILALFALVNYVITLVQPLLISWVASQNTPQEWSRIFFAYALIFAVLNVAFVLGARTEPRAWVHAAASGDGADGERATANPKEGVQFSEPQPPEQERF